jgi:hypothetical protein
VLIFKLSFNKTFKVFLRIIEAHQEFFKILLMNNGRPFSM